MLIYRRVHVLGQAIKMILPVFLLIVWMDSPVPAQESEEPQNLQVLPKDTKREQVIEIMEGFTRALNVRCDHCHARGASNPRRLDFASDKKENKKVARVMMHMAATINKHLLPQTGRSDLLQVQCITCHHGQARPQTLQQELQTAYHKGGIDTAVTRYKTLRQQYYGRGTFDFGEPALLYAARDFQQSNDTTVARTLLDLNLDYFPKSANTYAQLAELANQAGHRDQALAYFRKALQIQPQNGRIQRMMERMQNGN